MKKYTPNDEKILTGFYEHMNLDCNVNSSRVIWEFLQNAPCFEMFQLENIGFWYENIEIVTLIRLQSPWPGSVVIDNRSLNDDLLSDVIRYAEDTFHGVDKNKNYLIISINENESSLEQALVRQNYELLPNEYGTLHFSLDNYIPSITLPSAFEIKTLAEVFDFDKLNKLLWEGFQYEGKVPNINDEVYLPIKHAWSNYNRDICSVIIAPDGSYASFCGFWYDSITQTGYLEPMVTAKQFQNQGLEKCCVYNSLQILKSYGCKTVFVNPDEEPYNYYLKIGFVKTDYGTTYRKFL